MGLKQFLPLALAVFCASSFQAQTSESGRLSVTGDLRLHQFTSRIFNNTRTIRVLLPPRYDKNRNKKYPVFYLNDGQNLFDASTSVFNRMEWRVDETYKDLTDRGAIEPLIIVGIDNGGRHARENEYLLFEDIYLSPPLPNPEGAKYPEFLTGEVMPFIENRYQIKTGAEHTGLGGSSYGALIALYTAIRKPNTFGRLLLESPSLYVSDARILKDAGKWREPPGKIYLGVGTNESGQSNCAPGDVSQEAVRDVLKLKKILQDKGLGKNRLKVAVAECAIHNEEAWAKRFPAALKFLFPAKH